MKRLSILLTVLMTSVAALSQRLINGEYLIKINDTGRYLSIAGAGMTNGARLIQWDKGYDNHFRFILTHLGNDVYTLQSRHSGKFLSTEGAPRPGAKLIQWDWVNQDNQKWVIVPVKGSRGYAMSAYTGGLKVVIQHFNSLVTPANGAYSYLQGDPYFRTMILDFKKNEAN
ncbi:RICIN domain-containing protein [Paraflavitalea pollutisoli]|uniref:RICIN domain-containing protein n=1 Tax=Paraflavitalea pollutisoli TaxID=3034143 RepID=UPI0023ED4E7E|nr:RICIN domain-containing protein [Paraflavitalea sp. H1-2-19X]